MDRNDPPIIKSGARHSVQVAQGTRNAKSVRNVVTSDADAPIEDRFVRADEGIERGTAALRQGEVQEQRLALSPEDQFVLAPEGAAGVSTTVVDESVAALAGHNVVVESRVDPAAATQGPVLLREERGMNDVQVDKAQPEDEHRIRIDPDVAMADTEGVIVEGRKPIENRQRIQELQAKTNRIRLDAEQGRSDEGGHAVPGERVLRELDLAALREDPAATTSTAELAPVPDEEARPASAPAVAVPDEVANNLDHRAAAPAAEAKESALMARLRALKSTMSVTENRLTQLKPTDPPQS